MNSQYSISELEEAYGMTPRDLAESLVQDWGYKKAVAKISRRLEIEAEQASSVTEKSVSFAMRDNVFYHLVLIELGGFRNV